MKKIFVCSMILILSFVWTTFAFADEFDYARIYTPEKPIGNYNEAPMLQRMVEKGDLPSVEQRLPKNPPVTKVVDEIGEYGGEWNMYTPTSNFEFDFYGMNEPLFIRTRERELIPNLAESYEWNEDKTVLTVSLREGIRWSDGELFNAEDIMFYWEDYLNYTIDPEQKPDIPSVFRPGDEVMELTKIDDFTIKFEFAKPHPFFLHQISVSNSNFGLIPKHFLKEYHPEYVSDTDLSEEELFNEFTNRVEEYVQEYPDVPTLRAWKIDTRKLGERYIFTRNPYYWKTDREGNQLPYLDKVILTQIGDSEVATVQMSQGRFDYQTSQVSPDSVPVLARQEEKGNYEVYFINADSSAHPIQLNWNTPNEKLKKFIRNKDFRIALSHGVDREYIVDMAYEGLLTPGRAFIGPSNPLCEGEVCEWRELYAEYDPEKANRILDKLGLEKGDDGIREYQDGEEFSITFLTLGEGFEQHITAIDLLKETWEEELGIKIYMSQLDRGSWIERMTTQEDWEASLFNLGCATMFPVIYGRLFGLNNFWAWSSSYRRKDTDQYTEPPEIMVRLNELWEKIYWDPTLNQGERDDLVKNALKIWAYEIPYIGVGVEFQWPAIERNDFHNTGRERVLYGSNVRNYGEFRPEQFYSTRE